MKTIVEPNEKVIAILKTNKPEKEGLRLANWVVRYSQNGVNLLKNTFSGEIVSLSDEEYASPQKVEELVKHRFVVPNDYDEAEKYTETVKLIKIMQPEKKGLSSYTILPTTACNARCTYCYEEGYEVSTMSRETADKLVDFICKTRYDDEITLAWFGGEPLVCADTISYICDELRKRSVPFRSRMVTNASLLTKELAHKAKEQWNLKRVQVSLDGDKRDYTLRKRYIDPVRFNYDVVMRSIGYFADEDIKVALRVNFDLDSVDRLKPFLDEMKERFGNNKNVTLYLAALYQERSKPYYIDLERRMYELNRYIDNLGINNIEREKTHTKFRPNYCMAHTLEKSIAVDSKGNFYDCEHMPEGHTWGNIFDGVTDQQLFDKLSAPKEIDEKCRSCPFLPNCTPFYKNGCPCWFETCREYMQLKTEYELEKIANILSKSIEVEYK